MADGDEPKSQGNVRAVAVWKFGTVTASKMAGGMAGIVTAAATKNPFLGVAVNTALASALEKVGTYFIETKLGSRQEIRVGRAIVTAAVRMEERIGAGEKVRTDAFIEPNAEGRSDADEAVESALLAAMNSAEEKKVDFIGALMTSIALDPTISVADAQQMIETAQTLRYRAFVVLKIASNARIHCWPERGGEDAEGPPASLYPLMAQIYEMSRRGLIDMKDKPGDNNNYAILGADDIDPSKLCLSPLGQALYRNMELDRLPDSDPTYTSTLANLAVLSATGKGPARIDGGAF